jgi:hypothetical protein
VKAALYIVGALFELGGIVLIAAPDLVPGALRLAGRANRRWRPIENRIRRVLRLRPRRYVGSATLTGGIEFAGRISAVKGTSATTLEEKVEYLLRRDEEAQRATNEIRDAVADVRVEVARTLDELRDELRAHVAREITASDGAYRTARIAGTIALSLGLLLATLGNFA